MPVAREDLVSAFERDGFVNAGRVLTDSALQDLRSEVDALQAAPGALHDLGHDAGTHHYQIHNIWRRSPLFRAVTENQRMLEIAAALTNAKLIQLWADTLQYKPPGLGGPFNWHQDAPYHVGIRPYQGAIGAWIALDDADEDNGCMWMAPGSHKWGVQLPHLDRFKQLKERNALADITKPGNVSEQDWRGVEPCPVRAGEVHFHHCLTWHGSPTNLSTRTRRGYTIFLIPEPVRVTEVCAHIDLPKGACLLDAGPNYPILFSQAERQPLQ